MMTDLSDKVSELAPCPFCGGKATVSHPYRYQAICEACGARGPITKNAGDIEGMKLPASAWNCRAASAGEGAVAWRWRWGKLGNNTAWHLSTEKPGPFPEEGYEVELLYADRRTRPAASTMEGWRTMDSAPTGKVVLLWKPATREIYVACRVSGEHGPGWCTPDGFEIFGAEAWQYPPSPPTTPILPTA